MRERRGRPIADDVYTRAVRIEVEVNGLVDPRTGNLQVASRLLASVGAS